MKKSIWPRTRFTQVFILVLLSCSTSCKQHDNTNEIRKYVHVYADSTGESHFEDIEIELTTLDFAPPSPPLDVSAFTEATHYGFISAPPGWYGEWHPTPRRLVTFYLSGEVEVQVSDGEIRRFGPGTIVLAEDTTGKGHTSKVVSSNNALLAVVQLEN